MFYKSGIHSALYFSPLSRLNLDNSHNGSAEIVAFLEESKLFFLLYGNIYGGGRRWFDFHLILRKIKIMTYKLTSVIVKENKWYVAHCAELGVVSQGKTIEESQKNLKEAVELYLEDQPKARKYLSQNAPLVTTMELTHA